MPTKDNNAIKYNQGEKCIKLTFAVYADLECVHVKIIQMNYQQLKLINTYHLVIRYLLIAHLVNCKINSIVIEVKIACKSFVKIFKRTRHKNN